jgi:hypothetical protein
MTGRYAKLETLAILARTDQTALVFYAMRLLRVQIDALARRFEDEHPEPEQDRGHQVARRPNIGLTAACGSTSGQRCWSSTNLECGRTTD